VKHRTPGSFPCALRAADVLTSTSARQCCGKCSDRQSRCGHPSRRPFAALRMRMEQAAPSQTLTLRRRLGAISNHEVEQKRSVLTVRNLHWLRPNPAAETHRGANRPSAQKRKRPWGAGVFDSQLGGSWGSSHYPRGLWGAGKEPREFTKLLTGRCCCPNSKT
jgi:hypothetical protein